MAITATLLPNGKQQFFSAGGIPLAGGSVGMYAPGTLTFKTTWVDPKQAVPNANPITLDSGGEAIIYGFGQYRQIVKDSLGNIIWDQLTNDYLSLAQTGSYFGGTSGGTANNQTVTTTPGFSTYTQPITITFIAGFTNTGAMTLNANGIGALNVYKQTTTGPVPLTGGEIVNGNVYQVSYDGTEFQILSGAGSSVLWGATSGGSANTQTVTTTPPITFYAASQVLYFIAGFTNTGATTINANGIGAANIFKLLSTGKSALTGGEIVAGNLYQLAYDGTEFQLLTSNVAAIPQSGYRQNLKGIWVSNTTSTWTANQLMLLNSSNQPIIANSYSQTLNTATSGAGGLDTGSIAASTAYAVYAIYNATSLTTSILISVSFTAPTLPSGYTYSERIGSLRTDGSSNLIGFLQFGNKFQYMVGSNLTRLPVIVSGTAGNASVGSYVAVSITTFIPTTASEIIVQAYNAATGLIAAPNASYGALNTFTNAPPISMTVASMSVICNMVIESSNIYWASGGSGNGLACFGFVDNF